MCFISVRWNMKHPAVEEAHIFGGEFCSDRQTQGSVQTSDAFLREDMGTSPVVFTWKNKCSTHPTSKNCTCSMFTPLWADKLYSWLLWLQQSSGQQLDQVTEQQKRERVCQREKEEWNVHTPPCDTLHLGSATLNYWWKLVDNKFYVIANYAVCLSLSLSFLSLSLYIYIYMCVCVHVWSVL